MLQAEAQIKWTAQVPNVVEVSLFGQADLDYWSTKLAPEHLLPIDHNKKAQILIITGDARFRGVRFREISVSVLARRQGDPTDGAFLTQAWNSSRFFAWCERTFFKTPYVHAHVDISASDDRTLIQLADGQTTLFRAELRSPHSTHRQPAAHSPGGWSGPIFIPSRKPNDSPKHYFARLHGLTETYPFLPDTASLTLNPTPQSSSLQSLLNSHFTPTHWEIRRNATHARSKTFTHTPD